MIEFIVDWLFVLIPITFLIFCVIILSVVRIKTFKAEKEYHGMLSGCWDCGKPINASDDEAFICTQCGGRNRRV